VGSSSTLWPPLLHTWPTENIRGAQHVLGRRCTFALQSLYNTEEHHGKEWELLHGIWQKGGQAKYSELVGAYRIQNRGLMHNFIAHEKVMQSRLSCEDFNDGLGREGIVNMRLLWHGARSVSNLLDICNVGFYRSYATTCLFGTGCYFAVNSAYSDKYACGVKIPGASHRKLRAMVLAGVLVGETVQGTKDEYPPPIKRHSLSGERYENTCDNVTNPSIFVTYKDGQAVPLYVVVYESKT